jgi:ubiquinone biosynthesis protein
MLPDELVTSHLVAPWERPPVRIAEVQPPARWRTWIVLYQLACLGAALLWLRLSFRLTPTESARRLRGFLQRMGTIWVKAGQFMGMRSDLLPREFTMELAQLRDLGTGIPFAAAKRRIEQELGAPLERCFDQFEPAPFAATTGFQLHRARLRREQARVAVKIIRPYAKEIFRRDFEVIRRVTGWLRLLHIHPRMRWGDLCREINEAMVRELDLRYEAASLEQLRRTLPRHGIYVPQVFSKYSTTGLLVMEYIPGALIADYIALARSDPRRLAGWLQENGITPRKVAQRMFESLWRQVLEDNLFHADMSPYNVVFLRNNRLAVIDCRSVGSLEAESLEKHRMFIRALAAGQYATAAERSFLLLFRLPQVDLGEVKSQFVRVWRRWENRNFVRHLEPEEKSLTRMFDELNRIMYRWNFEVDWSMAKFAWTVVNADISIMRLAPDDNYHRWLQCYFRRADRRANRIKTDELARQANITWNAFAEMPRRISESTMALQDIFRRQARMLRGSTTKSGHFLAVLYDFLALGLVLLGGLCGFALAAQHYGASLPPILGNQLAAVVAALPLLNWWTWIAVLLLILYGRRRFIRLKRSHLQQRVQPGNRTSYAAATETP